MTARLTKLDLVNMRPVPGEIERILKARGFQCEGGPLLPALSGTITRTEDPAMGWVEFRQEIP